MNPTTARTMIAGTIATINAISVGMSSMIESSMGPIVPLMSIALAFATRSDPAASPPRTLYFQKLTGFTVTSVVIKERCPV